VPKNRRIVGKGKIELKNGKVKFGGEEEIFTFALWKS
jgi:hypothetical protein